MLTRLLTVGLVLAAGFGSVSAQTTICDRYTQALAGTRTSDTEQTVVNAVVTRAILGTSPSVSNNIGNSGCTPASLVELNGNNLNVRGTCGLNAIQAVTVNGINADTTLRAISRRASNGLIYVLGNDSQLYSLDVNGAINNGTIVSGGTSVTAVKVGDTSNNARAQAVAMDFNPAADRLRILTATKNFRVNPDTGAPADGANATSADGSAAGGDLTFQAPQAGTPSALAVAYTNDQTPAPTGTAMYVIDATGVLYIAPSPNNGTLNPVGPLGTNALSAASMDIITNGGNQYALAALTPSGGQRGVYTINLSTGAATLISNSAAVGKFTYAPIVSKLGPLNFVTGLVAANSSTLPYFNGQVKYKGDATVDYTTNSAALAVLTQSLVNFFGSSGALNCTATGFPAYTGRSMLAAHNNMNITKTVFNDFNTQVADSARSFGISSADIGTVGGVLASFGRTVPVTNNTICTDASCDIYNPNAASSTGGSGGGNNGGNSASGLSVSVATLLFAAVAALFAKRA